MQLTALESDMVGDFANDDHALYEVFHFVRLHHPSADDAEVFRLGREIIASWLERGWLQLSERNGLQLVCGLEGLLDLVDRKGATGMRGFQGAPWLELTAKATQDIEWLRSGG